MVIRRGPRDLRFLVFAVAASLVAACDRPAARRAAETRTAAAPDTFVRRVVRVPRVASAIQRITTDVHALQALVPMDSLLAIRVLDHRGAAMSGVAVQWSLISVGEGAALRVIDPRADGAGESRAAFTPGRLGDPQIVRASVRNVGAINFAIVVPPTSIRPTPSRGTLWSGEEEIVGAELRDVAGNVLPGGALSWGASDTSVLHVRTADASHAAVTGALAGAASLIAWVGDGSVRGSTPMAVRPVITGRFVTLDGTPVPPISMEVVSDDVRDSIRVDNGAFTKRVELPFEAETDVIAEPASSVFHRIRLHIVGQRELQRLRIALVPRSWRIDRGTYAGREIAIDAARAMHRTSYGAAFWRLVPISGKGPRKLLGWREADLPLRIAFNRARSREAISAEDSTRFWEIAAQMERDLGMQVFVPDDMRGDSTRRNMVTVEIGTHGSEGHTFVSWAQAGDASDGVVLFRQTATLRDAHVVTHELLHLLGFGHTTEWSTVSLPSGGREPRLTPEDVAHVQLAMRLRRLQHETGAVPGLPVANQ